MQCKCNQRRDTTGQKRAKKDLANPGLIYQNVNSIHGREDCFCPANQKESRAFSGIRLPSERNVSLGEQMTVAAPEGGRITLEKGESGSVSVE